MKRLFLILLAAVAVFFGILAGRTLYFPSVQPTAAPCNAPSLDADRAAARLAGMIRFQTISNRDTAQVDVAAFTALHAYLATTFPKVHAVCKRDVINTLSLLYTWPGSDPTLPPVLFIAHQDVVPVEALDTWEHPPFSGDIADGFVWGRGTLDDKGCLGAILESVETLLENGFTPKRTILLAFGHDEETCGANGAGAIAAHLKEQGIAPLFSLDEGSGISKGILPGLDRPAATIGITEKGYLTLELIAKGMGGHSSQPPRHTTLGRLSAAVVALENHPFPATLPAPLMLTFRYAGPEMSWPLRFVAANIDLLKPAVLKLLANKPATAAALRTTTAVTIMHGGTKDNVLPAEATATVNFRLLPGDTVAGITEAVKKLVDDDNITFRTVEAVEPSPLARCDTEAFASLTATIRQVFPETVVAPTMTMGGTDSRQYRDVVQDSYRFCPFVFTQETLDSIHGVNERVAIADYVNAVRFYAQLILNTTG